MSRDTTSTLWEAEDVNQKAIKGEKGTGYEGPKGLGPFECGNCEYYDPGDSSCGQRDMKAKSRRPRTETGRVRVHQHGCCEYVDRPARRTA